MNKLLLASASALALFSASAVQAEEVKAPEAWSTIDVNMYGEVRAFVEGGSADGQDLEVKASDTKIGVKAKSKGPAYAFGNIMLGVDVNGDGNDDVNTLYAYVGVGADKLGEASLGKTKSLADDWSNKTDVFMSAGNQAVQKPIKKMANSVKYTNSLGAFSVGGQAQLIDGATDETVDLYQIGAAYSGIVDVGATMANDVVADVTYFGLGVSKDIGPIMVAGGVSMMQPDAGTDVLGMEAVAGYTFGKTQVLGGFAKTDADGDDGDVNSEVNYKFASWATGFTNVEYDVASSDYTYRAGLSLTW